MKSKEEILSTLGDGGCLEGLPFMPEMLQFCGKRFRVFKRAHKTCDTVNKTGGRHMPHAVHLEGLRCDGAAHGGCQAGCFLFWKENWLRPVDQAAAPAASAGHAGCTEQELWAATRASGQKSPENPAYVCQATQIPAATLPLKCTDLRQYVEDYTSGNTSPGRILASFCFVLYRRVINLGIGLGRPMRWLYDLFQKCIGGVPYPFRPGKIPAGSRTPSVELNLQPGELVRVKSHDAILNTIDETYQNRGMRWDAEMVPYCGGTYHVRQRVQQIIDEKTGKMRKLKNPCLTLEGVVCQARYSECRYFCPRSIFPYWREAWLERVSESPAARPDSILKTR